VKQLNPQSAGVAAIPHSKTHGLGRGVPAAYATTTFTKDLIRVVPSAGLIARKHYVKPLGFEFFGRATPGHMMARQLQHNEARFHPVGELLADLERKRFFGSLELKLEDGHVVLIRKTETIKPTNYYRDNRGTGNGQ
jgi:hypothetical protein